MKQRTKDSYKAWSKTAKKSDKFIMEGVEYSQKEMNALLGEAPAEVEHTDIEEKGYGDMGQTPATGHTEES
tara:strand:+ start:1987 stop:2199 length:213 start_codon:yes stop_codon:yes gene_type:complete